MNAFWASENLDAFIVLRSSQPGRLRRKTLTQNDPVLGDQITTLRKIGERTVSGLWDPIGKLVDIFQPLDCANYFSSCGYDPD
jgi:hypothetical protein